MKQSKLLGLGTIALAAVMMTACGGDVPDPGNTTCDPACTDGKVCKDGQCVETSTDPCGGKCTGSQTCNESTGQCEDAAITCPSGQELCGSACADLKIDPDHCGSCDNACDGGKQCIDSACKLVCADGEDACDDGCHNLKTDANNCGECGKKCGDNEACVDGNCGVACAPGETECSGTCVNLLVNAENCGACGTKCGDNEACQNGSCAKSCAGGTELCGNDCLDLDSDASCGTCDNHPACNTAVGESCVNRECKNQCQANQTFCNNNCVDLKSDKNNCGECGHACEGEDVCNNGSCGADCGSLMNCNGNCIDPKTSNDYCGALEGCQDYVACGDGLSCQEGVCACANSGESVCDIGNGEKICTDPQTSETYCGCTDRAAGVNCAALPGTASSECKAGVCEFTCDDAHADCNQDVAGCEADLNSVETCGTCDNKCEDANADQTLCIAGACKYVCKEGTSECNGHCLDLSKDKDNCGWCGNKCEDRAECVDGFCTLGKDLCDADNYISLKVDDQDIKAYCIGTETAFREMRDNINQGKPYPDANNINNAYIIVDELVFGDESKWVPVGTSSNPFKKGYLLGNGKLITGNLTTNQSYSGLFGYITSSIVDGFNLNINLMVSSGNFHGVLVGQIDNSTITNIKIDGGIDTTTGSSSLIYFGGIAGQTQASVFKHCFTSGTYKIPYLWGGIIGVNRLGTTEIIESGSNANCEAIHKSDNYSDDYGGIAGYVAPSAILNIKDSYYSGTISSTSTENYPIYLGGLVGQTNASSTVNVENSRFDGAIKTSNNYIGGLVGMAFGALNIKSSYANGEVTGRNYVGGLVGKSDKGLVIDKSFSTGNVTGTQSYIGGLVGQATNGKIDNSYATGNVSSKLSYVGGFAGHINGGTISNSYATGSASGAAYVGGFAGNASNATINNIYSKGDATSSVGVAACQGGNHTCTGGAFGQIENTKLNTVYSKGTVKGGGYVGGLVGRLSGSTVENAAAFGSATCLTFGTDTGIRAGGLVGCAVDGWTITNSVAMGDAKGSDEVGSIIGGVHRANNTLRNVYATGVANGKAPGAIAGYFNGTGTFAIKNSYYWEGSAEKAVNIGTPAETAAYQFKYNSSNEAVLSVNEKRKLVESLGNDWVAATCNLGTGPKAEVTLPVPKALGADICK